MGTTSPQSAAPLAAFSDVGHLTHKIAANLRQGRVCLTTVAVFLHPKLRDRDSIFKDVRWVRLEELTNYDFLVADRGLIKDLAAGKPL